MKVYGKMNVNPEEVIENSEGNEIKIIKQINQMILEEAGEVQVPEGLLPDRILNMLEAGEAAEEMEAAKENKLQRKKKQRRKIVGIFILVTLPVLPYC